MDKITKKKMSREAPQNREEIHHHTKKGDRDVTFNAFS